MLINNLPWSIFGRPFVKWFALCYRTVDRSVMSVILVHCGQTVGRIKMKLDKQVGIGPGHIVLDGDPAAPPQRGTASPQFSANIGCGQMASWIKMPLGTNVGLGPGRIVLHGDLARCSPRERAQPPIFGMSIVAKRSPVSAILLNTCCTAHGSVLGPLPK